MAVSVNESFLKAQTQKTKNFSEFKTQTFLLPQVMSLFCPAGSLDRFPQFFLRSIVETHEPLPEFLDDCLNMSGNFVFGGLWLC